MRVEMKMPKKYWAEFDKALEIADSFYNLDFVKGFTMLFEKAFVKGNKIVDVEKNAKLVYDALFDSKIPFEDNKIKNYRKRFSKQNGSYNLEASELNEITCYLDFVIRIWLGQWREFYNIVNFFDGSITYLEDMTEHYLYYLRNAMLPRFDACGIISPNASFGIYSTELNNNIRIIYAIYKKIRFELYGDTRDDSICGEDYTKNIVVKLPYIAEYVVKDDLEDAKEFLDTFRVTMHTYDKRVSWVEDDGVGLFVYVNDMMSIKINKGTKIFVKYNKWCEVERDGNHYDYNTTVIRE